MIVLEPIAGDAAPLDRRRYGRLLAKFAPKVIETEAEHGAALAIAEALMEKGDEGRSLEEDALLELIADLIERFETKAWEPVPDSSPVEILQELMAANSLKPVDLAEVLGGRSRVSEILAGKRLISRGQAKQLGERFRISPAAFF